MNENILKENLQLNLEEFKAFKEASVTTQLNPEELGRKLQRYLNYVKEHLNSKADKG